VLGGTHELPTRSGALGAIDKLVAAERGEPVEWIPLTGLPTAAATEGVWVRVLQASWRWAEHIHFGESRSALIWLDLMVKIGLFGVNLADVSDSRSTLGLFAKGRASPFRFNCIGRRRANREAISGNRMGQVWTPTFWQVADEGTRDGVHLFADKTLQLLNPPRAIILDFSVGGVLEPAVLEEHAVKRIVMAWDVATLRGRGRLGAALFGGSVCGIVWELSLTDEGIIDVLVPCGKRSWRPPAAEHVMRRLECLLSLIERLVSGQTAIRGSPETIPEHPPPSPLPCPPLVCVVPAHVLTANASLATRLLANLPYYVWTVKPCHTPHTSTPGTTTSRNKFPLPVPCLVVSSTRIRNVRPVGFSPSSCPLPDGLPLSTRSALSRRLCQTVVR
jgi:hypothetical protein